MIHGLLLFAMWLGMMLPLSYTTAPRLVLTLPRDSVPVYDSLPATAVTYDINGKKVTTSTVTWLARTQGLVQITTTSRGHTATIMGLTQGTTVVVATWKRSDGTVVNDSGTVRVTRARPMPGTVRLYTKVDTLGNAVWDSILLLDTVKHVGNSICPYVVGLDKRGQPVTGWPVKLTSFDTTKAVIVPSAQCPDTSVNLALLPKPLWQPPVLVVDTVKPKPISVAVLFTSDIVSAGVSGRLVTVNGLPATPVGSPPGVWTTVLSPARWLWKTATVANPQVEDTATFTMQFPLLTVPDSVILELAADNGYKVFFNRQLVIDSLQATGTTYATPARYRLPAPVVGSDTVTIVIRNFANPNDPNPADNPAGVVFRVTAYASQPPALLTIQRKRPGAPPVTAQPRIKIKKP